MAAGRQLGDFELALYRFPSLTKVLKPFGEKGFKSLQFHEKQDRVNSALCKLIQETKAPCFLLAAVLEYIQKIEALGVLESYTLSHFELWLNQFSSISKEENYSIRAKIVGKDIPRAAYQGLFPIGMGKTYPGSHFVTAHGSPDLDTTVASFWGWVDAFAARVSEGLHLWNVPGGAPASVAEVDLLFYDLLGSNVFVSLAKTRTALALSAMDLMTQKGFVKEKGEQSILAIDHQGSHKAIVLVDESGQYVGDWKKGDVEGVRQVISSFNHCLRWFSHYVQMQLLSLFSASSVKKEEMTQFVRKIFSFSLEQAAPVSDFTRHQKEMFDLYLIRVLKMEKGLNTSFRELISVLEKLRIPEYRAFVKLLESPPLFDKAGRFIEERKQLLGYIQQVSVSLDAAFEKLRLFVERLDVALHVKSSVFGMTPNAIGYRADVNEIRAQMADQSYLSVASSDVDGYRVPLGVIHWEDLSKPILGTVTLRDFCNSEETKIPSYLEVISVIDHHKSQLQTTSAPMALIADAQSSNVLCAEMAFGINDRFSTGGMTPAGASKQAERLKKELSSAEAKRLFSRLLQKQAALEEKSGYFIDPQREILEYLQFFYGILDDTDLLTKVSLRDVECVVQLVNRLKSLFLKEEVEVLSLADLPYDEHFTKKAALRILQNPDVYSMYRKVYAAKEKSVIKSIVDEAKGEASTFFADTKEQNGCARVGQAKLFPSNYATFAKQMSALQKQWGKRAEDVFSHHAEIDLHMQMISTIAGADEVYAGSENHYKHNDELWIWIPFTEASVEHLKEFLSAFSKVPMLQKQPFTATFYGKKATNYAGIFTESFLPLTDKKIQKDHTLSFAVLKYKAGLLNSRKAMISPYLPRLVR